MTAIVPLSQLYKVTWSGLLGSDEIFQYSRWTTSDASSEVLVGNMYANDVTDMLGTTVVSGPVPTLSAAFPSHVHWTSLKVSKWDAAHDRLEPGSTPDLRVLANVPTGSTGNGLPYQCAFAMTTRSALTLQRKYCRFYLPPLVNTVTDGHGVMPNSVASAFTSWLQLNITARAVGSTPCVATNYSRSVPGPWTYPIVDVYTGHRIDTIQRRRNKAPEGRTTLAI